MAASDPIHDPVAILDDSVVAHSEESLSIRWFIYSIMINEMEEKK
jgi:hypothetical protein